MRKHYPRRRSITPIGGVPAHRPDVRRRRHQVGTAAVCIRRALRGEDHRLETPCCGPTGERRIDDLCCTDPVHGPEPGWKEQLEPVVGSPEGGIVRLDDATHGLAAQREPHRGAVTPCAQRPPGPGHKDRAALTRQPAAKRVERGAGGVVCILEGFIPDQRDGSPFDPAHVLVATVQREATMVVGQNAQ